MDFKGKVVIVTGASSGIGAGTAEYFARYGATLSLTGRNSTNLEEVATKCEQISGTRPLTVAVDLTKDYQKIIDETVRRFDQIDVLINNAGIGSRSTIETVTVDDYDRIFDTNVRSVLLLTQLAIPHLLKTKGNIVNVSSMLGIRSHAGSLVYSMSKAALDQFTKCISLELAGKGVRVNSVNPAVIVTNFQKHFLTPENYEQFLEDGKHTHPLGRVGNVEEVAGAIGFLASNAATFITGVLLPVCGGRTNLCPR